MRRHNAIIETLQVFYPILCVTVLAPLTIAVGKPWIGIALFIVILFLWRNWWTCVLGLANGMALWGGIIACTIPYVRMLRMALAE